MRTGLVRWALPLAISIEIAGLLATVYGWRALGRSASEADALRFDKLIDETTLAIDHRLDSYESVLHGGIGLLNASREVDFDEWRAYVASIPLERTSPGILGIGTIARVPAAERQDFIDAQVDATGGAFRYSTVGGVPQPREWSFIIDRIEPLAANRAALGLDIGSEANRLAAAQAAIASGAPQITEIIYLVQDDRRTPGFLLLIPRFDPNGELLDLVYAPMIGEHVLGNLVPQRSEIGFAVYDNLIADERLIHSSGKPPSTGSAALHDVVDLRYAGHDWRLRFWSTRHFVSRARSGPQTTLLVVGLCLSTLLAGVLLLIHLSHRRAIALAERMRQSAEGATRELAREQQIMDVFVRHAPAAIAIFDRELRYLAASQRWYQDYGLEGRDVIGASHYDIFHEIREMSEWREIHRRCLDGAVESRAEDPFPREHGGVDFISWEIHPWREPDGAIGGIIMFTRNVTDQVMARRQLEQARLEAEQTAQAKARFLATMSHEIRTPMNGVIGMTEQLQLTTLDERQTEYVDTIRHCGEALMGVINDILDYSKLEAQSVELERRPFRPRSLLDDATAILSEEVRRRGLTLTSELEPTVPRVLLGDIQRLRQVVLNLLSNAVKFTPEGAIHLHICCLAVEGDQARLAIVVRDEGIGMDRDAQERLFEPFSQADVSTTRRFGGTGLGLSICRRLVELMEGTIAIESAPGAGTEVRIELSLPIHAEAQQGGVARLAGRRVLYVDDNDTNRLLVEEQCRSWEVRVTSVATPVEALRLLRGEEGGYDLLLTDLSMPDIDGLMLVRLLRQMPPVQDLPVVIVSSDSARDRRLGKEMRQLGISAALSKPLRADQLHAALKDLFAEPPKPTEEQPAPAMVDHVLVAEDNPINQRLIEIQLKPHARRIDFADDGAKAVAMATATAYDLILMDCQMPVLDGLEATRRIRQRERDQDRKPTPIVALTANALPGDREACLEAGMNDYLIKPLDTALLDQAIRRVTGPADGEGS